MPKRTLFFLIFLALMAGLLGYNYFVQPFKPIVDKVMEDFSPQPSPTASVDPNLELMNQLSDLDKVSLVLAAPLKVDESLTAELLGDEASLVATTSVDATDSAQISALQQVIDLQPGMVTLFGDRISTQSASRVVQKLKSSILKPTVLIAVDHEGGRVQRLSGEGFTFLPSWQQVCQFSPEKKQELYQASTEELEAVGIDVVFGPVVDYATSHPVLSNRVCSGQPGTVVDETASLVAFYQEANILPVIKHFPGLGATSVDLHTSFEAVEITPEDALVYRQLLEIYPTIGVMTSHVGVANQYPDIPCSLSQPCVGQVAANFPEVLIISDALEMAAAGHQVGDSQTQPELLSLAERSIQAIEAGNHVLVYGPGVTPIELVAVRTALLERYQTNPIFKEQVDHSIEQILAVRGTMEI